MDEVPGKRRALVLAAGGLAVASTLGAVGNGLQALSDPASGLGFAAVASAVVSAVYLVVLQALRRAARGAFAATGVIGGLAITAMALIETEAGTYLYLCFGLTYLATSMHLICTRPMPARAAISVAFLVVLALRHALRPMASVPTYTELVFVGASGSVGVWVLSGWVQGVFDAHGRALRQSQQERVQLVDANHALEVARDRALEAGHAKDRFLANMSHELRTPLNAILGYTDLLVEEPDVDREQLLQDLGAIRTASTHLLSLVASVLDVAKLGEGAVEVSIREVDLAPLVDELAAAGRGLCVARDNTFVLDSYLQWATIRTDPTKLRQIVLNLLGNAAKFTEKGTVELHVRNTDDELVVHVRDSGVGIPPDRLDDVFERFVQVDASSTRVHGGAGLGLALARGFAWRLGGTLTVKSKVGRGSTFTLRIPARSARPEVW